MSKKPPREARARTSQAEIAADRAMLGKVRAMIEEMASRQYLGPREVDTVTKAAALVVTASAEVTKHERLAGQPL